MMMMLTTPDSPTYETTTSEHHQPAFPSWKLYDNPFYNSSQHHQRTNNNKKNKNSSIHHLNLPVSTRKIAASFWDLSFIRNIMQTEIDSARAQIIELKTELEYERRARKRAETVSKRLAKELAEERRGREAVERVCEELALEISFEKSEIDRVRKEFDEERKMLRIAEVLREERVQMKMNEAKILFEEKISELKEAKQTETTDTSICRNMESSKVSVPGILTASSSTRSLKFSRLALGEKAVDDNLRNVDIPSISIRQKASSEPENPHIKRGIKGFVEFPRVIRSIGSKSSRHWGTKLECQKAQLRILLKQKSPIRSNNLILS